MDLNQIGSYTSIIALVVMFVGGMVRGFKQYRAYTKKQKSEVQEFKEWLFRVVDESTTVTERSDTNSYVQHVLSQYRHIVLQSYLKILMYLIWAGLGYMVLVSIDLKFHAWVFLAAALGWAASEFWYLTRYREKVDQSQWEVTKALARHLNRTIERKRSKNSG